jgi:hypothetical protein
VYNNLPLSQQYLGRCARAWIRAEKKGLPIGTPLKVAEAPEILARVADSPSCDTMPSPERLFAVEAAEGGATAGPEAFDPERDALVLARKIRAYFFTPEGHARLRTAKQKNSFAKELNIQFETMGIDWEITPKGVSA